MCRVAEFLPEPTQLFRRCEQRAAPAPHFRVRTDGCVFDARSDHVGEDEVVAAGGEFGFGRVDVDRHRRRRRRARRHAEVPDARGADVAEERHLYGVEFAARGFALPHQRAGGRLVEGWAAQHGAHVDALAEGAGRVKRFDGFGRRSAWHLVFGEAVALAPVGEHHGRGRSKFA